MGDPVTEDSYRDVCVVDYIYLYGRLTCSRRREVLQEEMEDCLESAVFFAQVHEMAFSLRAKLRAEAAERVYHLKKRSVEEARRAIKRGATTSVPWILQASELTLADPDQGVLIETPAP